MQLPPKQEKPQERIADPAPKTGCHRNGGTHETKRFIINFGQSPLDTSTSVPTFGEIGGMPTKGKGEPSSKSSEGSPTLAGVHSAKVSTKTFGSVLAGADLSLQVLVHTNVCYVRPYPRTWPDSNRPSKALL